MKPFPVNDRPRTFTGRCRALVCGLFLCGLAVRAQGAETERRFEAPKMAMIDARAWDETHSQWHKGEPGEWYFDAAHRFLLVRFPGSAEVLQAAMLDGFAIESAVLTVHWQRQEFRAAQGYVNRPWVYEGKTPPDWHVEAWMLRRPWTDDPALGPTWNAWIQGAGWWRQGGAHDPSDRFPSPVGRAPLGEPSPTADIDVTAVLRQPVFGASMGARLRALEAHGFLLRREELSNFEFGESGMATAVARLWVAPPVLTVRLRPSREAAAPFDLPPPVDVVALAETLKADGGHGVPATRVPENLGALVDEWRARRRGHMPEWMWQRVQELWHMPHYRYGRADLRDVVSATYWALDSGDEARYREVVMPWTLNTAPGWFQGHANINDVLPLVAFPELLPEVVRYHLRRSIEARWRQPLSPETMHPHSKVMGMGTFNHMAQVRPKTLLNAEASGMQWLTDMAQYGMSLLNRQMIYSDGFSQELGDSYYRAITLVPLQAAARFSVDPVMRLKASLMVEKLRFEDIATYHPGLRHRVSRANRRMGGIHQYLLSQEGPDAMLHSLSREGVLIETHRLNDGPKVRDMDIIGMNDFPPTRVALVAPWGAEWEAHAIDRKALPFRSVFSTRSMLRVKHPIHAMTYMGQHYALASQESYDGVMPVFGAWRRAARPVERLEDFGILVLQGRLNDDDLNHRDKTPFGCLQHDNKLIWVVKPHERAFVAEGNRSLPDGVADGLFRFRAQAGFMQYGAESERGVYVNERKVETFPATATLADRITIHEGVTYIALLSLPATDLGRNNEVVIHAEHPTLTVSAYVFDREEPILADDDTEWARLADATAGWVVEFGDENEYGSFETFQSHIRDTQLETEWDAEARVLHIAYQSGSDRMEAGFFTGFDRPMLWHRPTDPTDIWTYRRVNGAWPWMADGIDMDNPLGQMGTAEVLEKGGARLRTTEGQMALLRIEPISRTTVGIHPFLEPTPFKLETPEGIVIQSEGPLGMARVTVQPGENTLRVDYALPPPDGVPGIEALWKAHPRWFARGEGAPKPQITDPALARARAARALFVMGFDGPPTVTRNGAPLRDPLAAFTLNGRTWYRVPIAE